VHVGVGNFLSADFVDQLRDFCAVKQSLFAPTRVKGVEYEPAIVLTSRNSVRTDLDDHLKTVFVDGISRLLPRLCAELGIAPFTPAEFETELVATPNAGFYTRHIDTFTGEDRARGRTRVVSCVYYFRQRPDAFSGGQLRLYPLPKPSETSPTPVDVWPEHNSLVVFSSWLPHEILPVSVPSAEFIDSRFSINCWVHK
jgi:SM-20-related protein